MKIDIRNRWRFVALVLIINSLIAAGTILLLFQSSLGNRMPDTLRLFGPVGLAAIACIFLITHRPK